jgi:hypothetical protein
VPPTTLYRLAGLAGTVGVEYVTNSVFPHLDDAVVESLVDGPTGTTLLLAAAGTAWLSASGDRPLSLVCRPPRVPCDRLGGSGDNLAPPPWTRVGA